MFTRLSIYLWVTSARMSILTLATGCADLFLCDFDNHEYVYFQGILVLDDLPGSFDVTPFVA